MTAKTPSQQAKDVGLKNLKQVAEITGRRYQTLDRWAKDEPKLFRVVLAGCVAVLKQDAYLSNKSTR